MKVGPGQARPESAVVYYSLVMASTNVGRLRRRPVVMSGTPRPAACAVGLLRFRLMSEGWAAHWYSSLSTFHPRHLGCPQIARGLSQNQTRPLSRSPQTLLLEGFPPNRSSDTAAQGGHFGVQPQSIIQDSRRSVFPCRAPGSCNLCCTVRAPRPRYLGPVDRLHARAREHGRLVVSSCAFRSTCLLLCCVVSRLRLLLAGNLHTSPYSVPGGPKQPLTTYVECAPHLSRRSTAPLPLKPKSRVLVSFWESIIV